MYKMRFNLSRELQDNKKSVSAVCSYLVEWPRENTDKYIQGKGISRWFEAGLPINSFESVLSK